jgi:hypothetical protein
MAPEVPFSSTEVILSPTHIFSKITLRNTPVCDYGSVLLLLYPVNEVLGTSGQCAGLGNPQTDPQWHPRGGGQTGTASQTTAMLYCEEWLTAANVQNALNGM